MRVEARQDKLEILAVLEVAVVLQVKVAGRKPEAQGTLHQHHQVKEITEALPAEVVQIMVVVVVVEREQ